MIKAIESIEHFYSFIKEFTADSRRFVFRGVKSVNYKLIPTIGRYLTNTKKKFEIKDEKKMLNLFKQKAYPFLKNDIGYIDLLAIAQHHGLPTRLLDWTWNPLVALFFAVRENWEDHEKIEDSLIYVWEKNILGQLDYKKETDPFKFTNIEVFLPHHVTTRIIAQSGIFTIHNSPQEEFAGDCIYKIKIVPEIREEIKQRLERLGIHSGTMFPDLDGIASYIKWLRTNIY